MIERGKYYRRRDGVVVGPAVPNDLRGKTAFPWLLSGIGYTTDGKFYASGKEDSHDLVSEFTELPMVPRPDFTVDLGDPLVSLATGEPEIGKDDPRDLKIADAYQVIGNLLTACRAFESDEGQRALDYFGISEEYDENFLPWPRQPLPDPKEEADALRDALRAANKKIGELTALLGSKLTETEGEHAVDPAGLLRTALGLMHGLRIDLSVFDRQKGCEQVISAAKTFESLCAHHGFAPDFDAAGRIIGAMPAREPTPDAAAVDPGMISFDFGIDRWDLYAAGALFSNVRSSSDGSAKWAADCADKLLAQRAKRGLK